MTTITITNESNPRITIHARVADTFFSKLRGLMFTKQLHPDQGLLLVDSFESRINASIHMLFMNYDLCVVWLDHNNSIVDCKYAKKWHFAYFPKRKALSVLELSSEQIANFKTGDQLRFQK